MDRSDSSAIHWKAMIGLAAKGVLATALCLLSACVSTTPYWDAQFGDTVRTAAAQQTLNPDASRDTDPVVGIDGKAAYEAAKRYHKSFQEPPPPAPLFQILNNGNGNGGQ